MQKVLENYHLERESARHKQFCTHDNWCSVIHILPSPAYLLEFKNFKFQTPAPFVIYIDLESILDPMIEPQGNTTFYQRHKCCSAAALLCSNIPIFNNHWFIYTGDDVHVRLLEKLVEWEEKCVIYLKSKRPMRDLTRNHRMRYDASTICCICKNENRPFDPYHDDWRKVHDHDHVTGYFFGGAHNLCNKRRRVVFQIPCFIHNLRKYDSNLIVQAFNKFMDREVRVIGQSMGKYLEIAWERTWCFETVFSI